MDGYLLPNPVLPILSSRGCYWKKCAFCDHFQNYSETYRARSAENIAAEIEYQKKNTMRNIFFFAMSRSLQRIL